jgi:hypothetical protein
MKPKKSKAVKQEKNTMGGIPQNLYDLTADNREAQLLVFCIFLDEKENILKIQRKLIAKAYFEESATSAEKFETIRSEVQKYPRDLYLNLVYICIPTLKSLSEEEYLKFKETLIKLIEADNKVSWSELNLKYLILYPLDIAFGIRKPARETCLYIGAIKRDAEVLLSKFTHYQFNNDELACAAFNKTVLSFGVGALEYQPSQNISIADLENAYNAAQTAKFPLKKKLFEMAAACLKTDGELSAHDTETLHALASLLHLPPP